MVTKRLWLDCDGVLLDWTRPFLQFSGLASRGVRYENIFDIDLTKLYKTPEEFYEVMHRYHESDYFHNLPSLVSPEELSVLRNMGWEIHVITQLENNPVVRMNRIGNLTKRFGAMFAQIHFTERGQSKLDYILNLYPGEKVVIVEDHPTLLKQVSDMVEDSLIERGQSQVLGFAVVHPYNEEALRNIPNVVKVPDTTHAVAALLTAECR